MGSDDDNNSLHQAIFENDITRLESLVKSCDVNEKDKHGNTPLHLAVMLGRKECMTILLDHGALVKVKNTAGWTALSEAVSYGDRSMISSLVCKLRAHVCEQMEQRRPRLVEALNSMGDFYLQLKWHFQSWIPLVSRILPSDVCYIHKKGSSIRMDATLLDFSNMRWERGDVTLIFNGDREPDKCIAVLDNKTKVYQWVRYNETEEEVQDEVDILMSSDIIAAEVSTQSLTFSRAQTGWFFKDDKKETVGPFHADLYVINGMHLKYRKRREHLSVDDLQRNRAFMEYFTRGKTHPEESTELERKKSLNPPPETGVTWREYIQCEAGNHPTLSRPLVYKETNKTYKATVAMSADFPLSVKNLLDILEIMAPFKHFKTLRDFVLMQLPPGFPVKVDIPILPTVTARITFQEFTFRDDIDTELFKIPSHYEEDPSRFPDL